MRTLVTGLTCSALVWLGGILPLSTFAITHVVQFGGSSGFAYSPNQFTASVGDTVMWEGVFSTHPLSSTTVPLGAQTWHATSGTQFSYVIAVAGTYRYQCDTHAGAGMTGSFVAASNAVIGDVPGQVATFADRAVLLAILTNGSQRIRLVVPRIGRVVASIHDARGRGSLILNAIVGPGGYDIPLDLPPSNGVYVVTAIADGMTQASAFAIVR